MNSATVNCRRQQVWREKKADHGGEGWRAAAQRCPEARGDFLEVAVGLAVHDGVWGGLTTAAELCRGQLEVMAAERESRVVLLGPWRSSEHGREELRMPRARSVQIQLAGEDDLAAAATRRTRGQNLDLRGWEATEG